MFSYIHISGYFREVLFRKLHIRGFPFSSVGNLPAVQETRVWSLGWEDPLEKEMATDSSILAWNISWTQEIGGLQYMGSQIVQHDWATNTYLVTYLLGQLLSIKGNWVD